METIYSLKDVILLLEQLHDAILYDQNNLKSLAKDIPAAVKAVGQKL
jgi:hypothetical protein